uniref:Uncharacterized protein n=1 Tax=Castor canadensis TaxID=51338 RepID=A0A8C0X908_CASCN
IAHLTITTKQAETKANHHLWTAIENIRNQKQIVNIFKVFCNHKAVSGC